MIEVMQVDAWVCSWCGWRWLKVGEVRPARCPSRKCRKLASSGESGQEKLNRIENKPRSPKPATRTTTQKAAAKAKTTASQPVEVRSQRENRQAKDDQHPTEKQVDQGSTLAAVIQRKIESGPTLAHNITCRCFVCQSRKIKRK